MVSVREQRWAERRDAVRAGVEHRALVPNGNEPPESDPGTVGPPTSEGGDPEGFMILGDVEPATTTHITPSRWSGWPDAWDVPRWGGRIAELVDTAWTCLDKNSLIAATMPPYRTEDGVIIGPTEWMRNPDPDLYAGWGEFLRGAFWDYQMGETFILATAWDMFGYPARFHVVEPWLVNAEMVGGRRRYNIGSIDVTNEILHIRYKSTTSDARGHGPLEAGATRVVAAAALARYATNVSRGGGIPPFALVSEAPLGSTQADELLHQWFESRMLHLGLPAVLSGGITIEKLGMSPKEMALLELSQFMEARIAVLLGVPPYLVGLPSGGDSLTYETTTALYDYHWRAGLRPFVAMIMEALSAWTLPPSQKLELNRDEYVRPGFGERVTAWATLHGIEDETGRAITAEQVAAAERLSGVQAPAILNGGN